uniref:Uncharacterized protein n=1 Tax=viral metagenome TaxID=1070528 RepID=A0A6M3IGE1_9ZZZZ
MIGKIPDGDKCTYGDEQYLCVCVENDRRTGWFKCGLFDVFVKKLDKCDECKEKAPEITFADTVATEPDAPEQEAVQPKTRKRGKK